MHLSDEVITWRCSAASENRFYLVTTLDLTLPSFDLLIYQGQSFQDIDYLESLTINIIKNDEEGLLAQGKITNKLPILVRAFEGSLNFQVAHPLWGIAIGKCERNVEFN